MAQFEHPATAVPAPGAAAPAPVGRISARRAFGELAAVYVTSFGLGVVSAIVLLRDPNFDSSGNIIDDLQSASLEIFSYVMQAAVVIFGVGYFSLRRGLTLSDVFGRFKRSEPYSATLYPVAPYPAGPYGAGPYGGAPYAAAWGSGYPTQTPAYPQVGFPNGYPQGGYGVRQPPERSPGWQFARAFFLAMGGFIAFLIVAVVYADVTNQSTGAPSQGSSLWLIPVGVFVSAAAGFGEEMLITGMVVTTLEQAGFGKRAWVIYLVAIALRIPFHLYYGWAAVGVICFTVTNVWVYRRWRLLWPIVLAHMAYDLIESVSQTIPGNAASLPIVGLALVTIIMVIIIACVEGSDASARRRYRAFVAYQAGMAQAAMPQDPVQPGPPQPGPHLQAAAIPVAPPTGNPQATNGPEPADAPPLLQPSQFSWATHQPQSPPQSQPLLQSADTPQQLPAPEVPHTAQSPHSPDPADSPQFPMF